MTQTSSALAAAFAPFADLAESLLAEGATGEDGSHDAAHRSGHADAGNRLIRLVDVQAAILRSNVNRVI